MPFGPYTNFSDCVSKNQDKSSPEAYCAVVHKKITGDYPSEKRLNKQEEVMANYMINKNDFFNILTLSSEYMIAKESANGERIFEGWGSVEVIDRQGDLLPIDAMKEIMPIIMKRGGPLIDSHSNRVIGKLLDYQIFKDYSIDDKVWNSIKTGEYKGFSLGGKARNVETVIKDGKSFHRVNKPEVWEWSVVGEPANQESFIENINYIAKSMSKETPQDVGSNRYYEGRERDQIANDLYGKEFNDLDDAQKWKVHQKALENQTNKTAQSMSKDDIKNYVEKILKEKMADTKKEDTTEDPSKVLDEKPKDSKEVPDTGTEKQDEPVAEEAMADDVIQRVADKLDEISVGMGKILKALVKEDLPEEEKKPEEIAEEEKPEEEEVKSLVSQEVEKQLKKRALQTSTTPRPGLAEERKGFLVKEEKTLEKGMLKDTSWRTLGKEAYKKNGI